MSLDEVSESLELKSKDGVCVQVNRKNAMISKMVAITLENDPAASEVLCTQVSIETLNQIAEYMAYRAGSETTLPKKPIVSKSMQDNCADKRDADFIEKISENRQALYDLILAANFMDIPVLLHLGCAKVATLIKGVPLEKAREVLAP